LAIGLVAFEVNLLIGHPNRFDAAPSAALTTILLGSVSALCGLLTTITRLLDFRYTAKILWTSDKQEQIRLQKRAECLGQATWGFLWVQLVTFGLATIAAAVWVWTVISARVV
jgi:hypothetical protein